MLRQLERKNAQDEYERFENEFATFMLVTDVGDSLQY